MSYYLVVEDEPVICEIIEMTLSSKFKLNIEIAYSGKEALKVIESKGTPELIISDYRMPNGDGLYLYQTLKEMKVNSPFIICSSDPLPSIKEKFPEAYAYLEKPKMIDDMISVVGDIVQKDNLTPLPVPPSYVPIRISHLLRLGELNCDLYVKLSEEKFVKVLRKGETFMEIEAERFTSKNITHMYITKDDCQNFLRIFQQNLEMLSTSRNSSDNKTRDSLESLQIVERLSRTLGWTPQMVATAKKSVNLAITAISTEPSIFKVLKNRLNNSESSYMNHAGTLAMLSCVFCQQLGWTSDSAQMKLAMSALMHDMCLEEVYMNNINSWNDLARNHKEKRPEIEKYRSHPAEAAKLIQSIRNLPPDIDQIIYQHHESPNGSGFPRGLSSGWISPMSSVFIIAEDFLNFIGEEEEGLRKKVDEFLHDRELVYNEGNFKRVFQILKHHMMLVR